MINLINKQKEYFNTNITKDYKFKLNNLIKLKELLISHEEEIYDALKSDLNKSKFESYATELSLIYDELNYMIKNVKKFSKRKKVKTSIIHYPAKSFEMYEPYGTVLIISAWNYPFQLSLIPLISAIASGNTVILKTSETAGESEVVLSKILSNFSKEYILCINGNEEINKEILKYKFDYIFFTGSTKVGKIVYEKASVHLTPVTLELGGKCPTIIDETAKIKLACKRIVWGKLINSGQTCVSPDYLLINESIKEEVINNLKYYINEFYNDPLNNEEYPKIINDIHLNRLNNLINKSNVIYGGNTLNNKIEPTIIDSSFEDEIMKEEIFGPLIPIITYNNLDEVINILKNKPKSLALYIFSESKTNINKIINNISYGGGCINDTIIHLANKNLSFGGVGDSGIGSYHGKKGYETFSHKKSILVRGTYLDIFIRYAPFKNKLNLLKKIMK